MRSKIVKVANKDILIQEKTIGEIKKLASEINVDFNKLADTDLKNDNALASIFEVLESRITTIFPTLTSEDIDNAYISEIEELIQGFLDVNFSMLKKVFTKTTTMI